jgi:hypothetical protein
VATLLTASAKLEIAEAMASSSLMHVSVGDQADEPCLGRRVFERRGWENGREKHNVQRARENPMKIPPKRKTGSTEG